MPATNGHHLAELGFDVIYEDIDFFEQDLGECAVPKARFFSELPGVLARLRELGKPFVVIMPCSTLTTHYFGYPFPDIQAIVPRWRIQFRKLMDGVVVPNCLYFCWPGCWGTSCSCCDGRLYPPVKNESMWQGRNNFP